MSHQDFVLIPANVRVKEFRFLLGFWRLLPGSCSRRRLEAVLEESKERTTQHLFFQSAGESSWAVLAVAQRAEVLATALSAAATERQRHLAVLTPQQPAA